MIAPLTQLVQLSTEAAAEGAEPAGAMPYVAGVVALVILLALLFGVLAFGKGRDHS